MRATLLPSLAAFLCCFCGGCFGETWTFRVAHDVQILGSDSGIRPGPLTLVPATGEAAPVNPEVSSQKLTDAMLREKMDIRARAQAELTKRRNQLGESHPDVLKQKEVLAAADRDIAEVTQRASARQASMAANPGKPKTVLMIKMDHVGPGPISTQIGSVLIDRYSRMLVLTLDQPLGNETVWATPDNAILINYSPYTPPERTYVGVEGSIKIVSVKGDDLVADVSIRMRNDVDETDADFFRFPWQLDRRCKFTVATSRDPLFRTGAIRFGVPSVAPTTQPIAQVSARSE